MKLKFNKQKFSLFLASALIFGICKNNKALAMDYISDFEILDTEKSEKTEKDAWTIYRFNGNGKGKR